MPPPKKNAPQPQKELTLLGHLEELRWRLIICVASTFVLTVGAFFFSRPVLELLIRPVVARPMFGPARPQPEQLTILVAPDGTLRLQEPERLTALLDRPEPPQVVFQPESGDEAGAAELGGADRTTAEAADGADPGPPSRPDAAAPSAPDASGLPARAPALAADPTHDTLARSVPIAGGPAARSDLIYTHPLDPFMMPFKVAIVMGILLSLVVWVWQIWLFVAPGLTEKEKRVVGPLLFGAIFLFPLGAGFAYLLFFLLIPVMQGYIVPGIVTLYTIRDYLRLMTNMMIVFGFIFELPLVVALLARIGIVTPAFLQHYRRHIYVGLAVLAMVITPADPFSMMIALVPLIALFEVSIVLSGVMARLRARDFEDETTGGVA